MSAQTENITPAGLQTSYLIRHSYSSLGLHSVGPTGRPSTRSSPCHTTSPSRTTFPSCGTAYSPLARPPSLLAARPSPLRRAPITLGMPSFGKREHMGYNCILGPPPRHSAVGGSTTVAEAPASERHFSLSPLVVCLPLLSFGRARPNSPPHESSTGARAASAMSVALPASHCSLHYAGAARSHLPQQRERSLASPPATSCARGHLALLCRRNPRVKDGEERFEPMTQIWWPLFGCCSWSGIDLWAQ